MDAPHVLAMATLRLALCSTYRSLIGRLTDDITTWVGEMLPQNVDQFTDREMRRQLESMVDRLARELALIQTSGENDVSLDNYASALRPMAELLDQRSHTMTASEGIARKLPSVLAGTFKDDLLDTWDDETVDEMAQGYGTSALVLCCYMAPAWAKLFPVDCTPPAWGALVSTSRLLDETQRMIRDARAAAATGIGDIARILGLQRFDITSELGSMELFGLPFERRFRRVPITVSYMSGRLTEQPTQPNPRGARLDRLIEELAKGLTGRGLRLVIQGKAGSGKTTAAQWLAVVAAQRGLPALTARGPSLLPLFVRLREAVATDRAPADRMLLYSSQLRDQVQSTWLDDCRNQVTPLILLDGWDEIAAERIGVAEAWIQSLARRFPHAHIVVTSRPEGLDVTAFHKSQFKIVTILPLVPEEAAHLAECWFNGFNNQLYVDATTERADLQRARSELLQDLRNPAISDMADTPLLTSMFCCLYMTGHRITPEKRGELYDMVVSTLLHKREGAKRFSESKWTSLGLEQKETLVGALARAMVERARMTLPVKKSAETTAPDIARIIAWELPALGIPRSETDEWTNAVLTRSVVLQRVSSNEVEFIHRSIRDYLAAKVLREDLDKLLRLTKPGEWALLPFACHDADIQVRDKIVTWILDQLSHSSQPEDRVLLTVLVECYGAAAKLSPDLRARAEQTIATFFPPQDELEVKTIAPLGNAALPFLAAARITDPAGRRLAINTLSRINTTEAMKELGAYARQSVATDSEALVAGLRWFDHTTYAERVLNQSNKDLDVSVDDGSALPALGRVDNITGLTLNRINLEKGAVVASHMPLRLRRLRLFRCGDMGSLEWTAKFSELRMLSIMEVEDPISLAAVGPPDLWSLHMRDVALADTASLDAALRDKKKIRVIDLSGIRPPSDSSVDLDGLTNLNTVSITGGVLCSSLGFVPKNPKLARLDLDQSLSEEDIKNLARSTSLRTLSVRFTPNKNYAGDLADAHSITDLTLTAAPATLLSALHGAVSIRHLHLRQTDLELSAIYFIPPDLRKLTLTDCKLHDAFERGDTVGDRNRIFGIQELACRNVTLPDLTFLARMPALKRLDIEDNGSVGSLDGLESVPDGCSVRLVGTRWGLDEAPLDDLRRRCEVVYQPDYDLDTFGEGYFVDYGGA